MFIKYPKVKRLGHEDTDGILMGTVTIQEKIDGANASIWMEDEEIKCGSRTRILDAGFNGFVDYAKTHEGVREYLEKHPDHRLYGEWLVRHTISYGETAYKQFYLFDILVIPENVEVPDPVKATGNIKDKEHEETRTRDIVRQCKWLSPEQVREVADTHNIKRPEFLGKLTDVMPDAFDELVGKSALGEKGEGIVIRNDEFINKWGDRVCAKIVTQEFKEDNALVFGGNNKFSETYHEQKMVNDFMTLARIQKIMHKLQPQIDKKLDMEHTGRIIATAYHDMFEEELWGFTKKHKQIDFGQLQRLAMRKAAKIYHDLLNGHTSVAYETSDNI